MLLHFLGDIFKWYNLRCGITQTGIIWFIKYIAFSSSLVDILKNAVVVIGMCVKPFSYEDDLPLCIP